MKRIEDLWRRAGIDEPVPLNYCPVKPGKKHKVNVLALGDVGASVLTGLRLLGGDVVSQIGIYDMSRENMERLEQEMNQINYPFGGQALPPVVLLAEDELFDCDVFVFCASKGVPPLSAKGDVRMVQLEANREIARLYGAKAADAEYKGLIAVVSDPVDPLCRAFLESSGLAPAQIQGYGLGVMNTRALYFAEKDPRFGVYAEEGRAFGPHGSDLVIANSLIHYDDELSKELTDLVTGANLAIRALGFKPYIAPAFSSGAISLLLTLRGEWHYGSLYLGDDSRGAFFGLKNTMSEAGPVYEDVLLCDALFDRLYAAYENLLSL